jgi:TIR domain
MPLSRSQRIVLIKEISGRLGAEDWALIDLTLQQFSLPTTDVWSGTKEGYIVQMIREASDEALIDLAQHVGFSLEGTTRPRLEPLFWRNGMFRLFVTHLAVHRAFAADLQAELVRLGISCFVAHNDIEPTLEWQAEIETALATCDALVALLHKGFHASKWADQEIGFAMGRGVPAFAVKFDEDPYGFIGRFQAFNGNDKTADEIAQELFDAMRKKKETGRKMADALVGLFERSDTFAEAKARMNLLEGITSWDPSFSTRIRSAVQSNSQISGSWGVPERVDNLLKKWAGPGPLS